MDRDEIMAEIGKMLDLHLRIRMGTSVCCRLDDGSMVNVRFSTMSAERVAEIERQAGGEDGEITFREGELP